LIATSATSENGGKKEKKKKEKTTAYVALQCLTILPKKNLRKTWENVMWNTFFQQNFAIFAA